MKYFLMCLIFAIVGCQHRIYVHDQNTDLVIEIRENDLDSFLKMSNRVVVKNELSGDIGDGMVVE